MPVCSVQEVMKRFRLREQAGADPQTYALGLKEVWEVSKPLFSSHWCTPILLKCSSVLTQSTCSEFTTA